jgi:hypothetical protein
MLFTLYIQMHQALGPSSSPVFPLESAGGVFPFCDQADLFQSFTSGTMENQCSMGLLDMAPHAAPYGFEKQVNIVASKNYSIPSYRVFLISLIVILFASSFQQQDFWEANTQTSLHMDNEQSQENGVSAPNFDGSYT